MLLEHIDKMGLASFLKAGLNNLVFPMLLLRGGESSQYGKNISLGRSKLKDRNKKKKLETEVLNKKCGHTLTTSIITQ